jgi:hypothetical protein
MHCFCSLGPDCRSYRAPSRKAPDPVHASGLANAVSKVQGRSDAVALGGQIAHLDLVVRSASRQLANTTPCSKRIAALSGHRGHQRVSWNRMLLVQPDAHNQPPASSQRHSDQPGCGGPSEQPRMATPAWRGSPDGSRCCQGSPRPSTVLLSTSVEAFCESID